LLDLLDLRGCIVTIDAMGCQKVDDGHRRIERRVFSLETDIEWLTQKPDWRGLRGIGMVQSFVEEKGQTREETRYFITSLVDIEPFSNAVRKHWGIENSLHYCLDVTFHEDANRTRKYNSPENRAVIVRVALNILKSHHTPKKMSIARKRRKCLYDEDFMAEVLLSAGV